MPSTNNAMKTTRAIDAAKMTVPTNHARQSGARIVENSTHGTSAAQGPHPPPCGTTGYLPT